MTRTDSTSFLQSSLHLTSRSIVRQDSRHADLSPCVASTGPFSVPGATFRVAD